MHFYRDFSFLLKECFVPFLIEIVLKQVTGMIKATQNLRMAKMYSKAGLIEGSKTTTSWYAFSIF
ncbi:hypothetical protein SDC9_195097 [bioreactor metagenome]|uniref:Uncharacterized protein n=1 Tax=bioreactor metagenome TaxID=1076179 RepID=A0A645I828_9ZZZZ